MHNDKIEGISGMASRVCARTVALAAVMVGLATSSHAGAQATTTTLLVDPNGPVVQAPTLARRGRELMVLNVRAPRAVRLEGDVDAQSAARAAASSNFPLRAGQILLGSDERPGMFCTPVSSRGLGMAGPCLTDSNGDGRFDTITKAGFHSARADHILLTASSKVVGVALDRSTSLPVTVAYSPVDYGLGHSAAVRLNWSSDFRRNRPGRPISGSLWLDASARFTGTGIVSRTVPFEFSGQPETVTIGGITVRILGFDETGAMQFQIAAIEGGTPVEFAFRRAAIINFIVVYR
jgi:hypothetical protein